MLPKQSLAGLLFLSVSSLLFIPATGGSKEKTHQRVMRFFGTAETGDNSFLISGIVGPDTFFKNLHSTESPEGAVILNELGEVQFFPERMTINVHIIGPVFTKRKGRVASDSAFELMQGLTFKAQWKRGMKLRPVREFRLLAASETKFPNLDRLPDASGRFTSGWTYELVLEDIEVPVSDHLILYVFSPDDTLLARLSAHL